MSGFLLLFFTSDEYVFIFNSHYSFPIHGCYKMAFVELNQDFQSDSFVDSDSYQTF